MKGCIFDLYGVIVDTAKYHYLSWKEIASELGFEFTEKDNELLKGVSRMASLEILLNIGGSGQYECRLWESFGDHVAGWIFGQVECRF